MWQCQQKNQKDVFNSTDKNFLDLRDFGKEWTECDSHFNVKRRDTIGRILREIILEENKSSGDILSREMEDLNLNGLYFDEFQKMRVMVS